VTLPEIDVYQPITFTQPAAEAVREVLSQKNLPGYALRLFISGGGCSGYQYGLALDSNVRTDDLIIETDGIRLIVDEVSIKYLHGATVDYVDDPASSGFKIINPNMISSCGCGQSSNSAEGEDSSGCSGCGC
jgi:iron-sulfur cluster assembly accessory protein